MIETHCTVQILNKLPVAGDAGGVLPGILEIQLSILVYKLIVHQSVVCCVTKLLKDLLRVET